MDRRGPLVLVIAVSLVFLGIVAIVGGAVALQIGPFARPPGTPVPSRSVAPSTAVQPTDTTSQPTPAVTLTPSQPPTASLTPSPSEAPTDTPTLPSPPPGPPLTPEEELVGHVPPTLRASCQPAEPDPSFLAGVECSSNDDAISVAYFLYASTDEMYATYNEMFESAEIDADSGRCYDVDGDTINASPNRWPAEHDYSVGQQPVGRYLCLEVRDGPAIFWTDGRFDIYAVARASGGDADRLVRFWLNQAGPVP